MKSAVQILLVAGLLASGPLQADDSVFEKPRVIVTSDGEIDDQCSMIRFMLYTNEFDVEAIISSSSQYHAHDNDWAGDDWIEPDLAAYTQVYSNLVKHDSRYPTPEYLRERVALGNVKTEGDMAEPTAGSDLIVKVLLDDSDDRPVWMQAWGGLNTIARALKTIEEDHPERMAEVAKKFRIFGIWEQDRTYQDYIRPVWGKYEIQTIIADQFEAIAYRWKRIQPPEMAKYFEGKWMRENLLENHGPLTEIYASHQNGDFRSEGDSPAFLHTLVTGLRNMESPDWGGWGGRYVRVRENTWLDPVPVSGYVYPEGRWYGGNAWGRHSLRDWSTATNEQRKEYFKPMWRWTVAMQNDFAARADWCVKSYDEANHPPVVKLAHGIDLVAKPGETVELSAEGTTDPDGDSLTYRWWQYEEADTFAGLVELIGADLQVASFTMPVDGSHGQTIHVVCEVTDSGSPRISRYQRVVVKIDDPLVTPEVKTNADGLVEIPPMAAYFPLDGESGGLVTDEVSGVTGVFENADPTVSWIPGVVGNALHLDGRDDRIIIPHNESFDFGDESFSIAFRMRWPENLRSGHEHILAKGDYDSSLPDETGKRYEIFISGGHLLFSIDDANQMSQIQVSLEPYITGEWVHVAAVRDTEDRRLRLYANGVLLPPSNPGNPGNDGRENSGSIENQHGLVIGDAVRKGSPFQGDIDDLRLYRAALTHNQVAAIASGSALIEKLPVVEESVSKANESELPPLAAHFPLDDGHGLVVKESVSGVEVSVVNTEPDTVWASSDNGIALKLDGIDDRIIVPNGPGFDFEDESFSVAFHLRWTKAPANNQGHILSKGDYDRSVNGETGKRWEVNMTPEGLLFVVDDSVIESQIRVTNEAILKGFWVHVVAVRDVESKQLRLYVNGELQESTDPGNNLFGGVDQTGSISNPRDLIIGDSSRLDNPLNGEISDIRIYRHALNESQIAETARLKRRASANPEHGFAGATILQHEADSELGNPRIIVTSDGEIDDQCSMIRFLMYANEWDIEGIITSSSQYHWQGHKWAGDDWIEPNLDAYQKVYENLSKHADGYPTPDYLRSITLLGNVKAEGEMEKVTAGSQLIVDVLLDESDHRPIWLQAWGGVNTIARALKTIEEEHPDKMEYVAGKIRLYLIWEQDKTYQDYIKPVWGKYNILTIISDQFISYFYAWKEYLPENEKNYLVGSWMNEHIIKGHGPLAAEYKAHVEGGKDGFDDGDFRSEGDSPAFLHNILTGLRSMESPDWGGWGGRYVNIRDNEWLDPVLEAGYEYPDGRWYTRSAWGRSRLRQKIPNDVELTEYLKPTWRWIEAIQKDFASRADWCVLPYEEANHPPEVVIAHDLNQEVEREAVVKLSAKGTNDPDGDKLTYHWWQYEEADSYPGQINLRKAKKRDASFRVPSDARSGDTIHIVCEVTDDGEHELTRYQRVVLSVK